MSKYHCVVIKECGGGHREIGSIVGEYDDINAAFRNINVYNSTWPLCNCRAEVQDNKERETND